LEIVYYGKGKMEKGFVIVMEEVIEALFLPFPERMEMILFCMKVLSFQAIVVWNS